MRRDPSLPESPLAIPRIEISGTPHNAETPPAALEQAITPQGSHFLRSHFAIPQPSETSLLVDDTGIELSELIELGSRTFAVTLECAGNGRLGMMPLPVGEPWGDGAVSTAVWTGVPLRLLLERVGLRDDAVEILAEGADGFARSLPIEDALDPDTLLAFEMNGRPLSAEHGAPLRLLVPGWYGMASVKWLARLRTLTQPFAGFYQMERYVYDAQHPVSRMRVKSYVVRPRADETVALGEVHAHGWAWSGFAEIERVDVSLDGGDSWQPATVGRPLSPHSWWPWEIAFEIDRPGRHTLRARATDATGHVQPCESQWNRLGYGVNAVALRCFSVL